MQQEKEILALNAFDQDRVSSIDPALREAVQRRLRSFGKASVLFYQEPIRMVRAEGVYMVDVDGRRYLDLYNNVPSVGHSHPRVVEAISRQASLLSTHTRYLNDVVDGYAERLLATFPRGIDHLVLTCTGSEANDLALRVAKVATGRTGFIVTETAYHGNSTAVTDVSPSSRPGQPLPPHVRAVPAPEMYRNPVGDPGQRFAESVAAAITDLERSGFGFAALLVDTIFSSDGIYADPAGFLAPTAKLVHERQGLFIADEVQPGFGRTGAAMWGFARHGVVPDIVTMGKPMGNGFPMGGVAMRAALLDGFAAEVKYFNTFGGNPVAAAAGLAVLDVIEDEGLMQNAGEVGRHLMDGLREIGNRHMTIGDVRGAGLFIGLELVRDRDSKEPAPELASLLINRLRRRGILIGAAGPFGSTLKIRPPLCFGKYHADMFITACDEELRAIAAS
ncbi:MULTISPECIES: aspartate aminotransferase family protein [Bradyrhizobium]|uniref:4-aminobutyrate aminotransferase-like enzyme n=1 Tax=Bradyrhizobium elkanii TaxID=29448 RepID=A0A8I1Y8Z8_BRAEL|nr:MULTISPECIES: aspartate aminotransferase family protein [Bradyrhizobium]MBP1295525.1 4-aminobutyrate aminotransferase-like enzyme [Bradyrhizobium elkanii]MCP1933576.1 4-aminobutyrate aminotransferase-like enzyme [Bradyrhizobium elkanii]MCP1967985.1 4-aminobutyrate aminotransferase-like enzyme [Bradyrhizobium elkanii]MCS3478415.1 4-aminobutyrate aminotransferase-like enzyme [Bradyrhizobium elkanii]MCS3585188.1 4-aminobutyrate aminotransferase-like enzyme [Bradyrhizobium elkanii]